MELFKKFNIASDETGNKYLQFGKVLGHSQLNFSGDQIHGGGYWETNPNQMEEIYFYSSSERYGYPKKEDLIEAIKNSLQDQQNSFTNFVKMKKITNFFYSECSSFELAFERGEEITQLVMEKVMDEVMVQNEVEVFEERKNLDAIPDKILSLAFKALALSLLQDGMTSSISKYFIFDGMKNKLKEHLSEEDYEKFIAVWKEAVEKFLSTNSFMG